MNENWTEEELKAAIEAYIEMREKQKKGESYTKKRYYVDLASRFNRTEKSFEYRMQNISLLDKLKTDHKAGFAIGSPKNLPVDCYEFAMRDKRPIIFFGSSPPRNL